MTARRRLVRSLLVWVIGAGVFRATLWAPEICPEITASQARATALGAADWIAAGQDADGRYTYEIDRSTGTELGGYNAVRHAGVTMSLFQLARAGEDARLIVADAGLSWMLDRVEPAGGGQALTMSSRAKLGASALMVIALAQRRLATESTTHDALMQGLGRFIVGQQQDDGSMLAYYDLDAQEPVADQTSVFATGEALWALALLHEAFPDEGFEDPAWLTLDYLASERDLAEGLLPPPWPDQWAAYALNEMSDWQLEDRHIDYARSLIERFVLLIRFDSQRGTRYGSLTHGPAARGAGTGTWIEGLGALHALTMTDARLQRVAEPVAEALACGAARLARRQVRAGPDVPPTIAGAWFYDNKTRMDDQQHAASGMLLAEAVLP